MFVMLANKDPDDWERRERKSDIFRTKIIQERLR